MLHLLQTRDQTCICSLGKVGSSPTTIKYIQFIINCQQGSRSSNSIKKVVFFTISLNMTFNTALNTYIHLKPNLFIIFHYQGMTDSPPNSPRPIHPNDRLGGDLLCWVILGITPSRKSSAAGSTFPHLPSGSFLKKIKQFVMLLAKNQAQIMRQGKKVFPSEDQVLKIKFMRISELLIQILLLIMSDGSAAQKIVNFIKNVTSDFVLAIIKILADKSILKIVLMTSGPVLICVPGYSIYVHFPGDQQTSSPQQKAEWAKLIQMGKTQNTEVKPRL